MASADLHVRELLRQLSDLETRRRMTSMEISSVAAKIEDMNSCGREKRGELGVLQQKHQDLQRRDEALDLQCQRLGLEASTRRAMLSAARVEEPILLQNSQRQQKQQQSSLNEWVDAVQQLESDAAAWGLPFTIPIQSNGEPAPADGTHPAPNESSPSSADAHNKEALPTADTSHITFDCSLSNIRTATDAQAELDCLDSDIARYQTEIKEFHRRELEEQRRREEQIRVAASATAAKTSLSANHVGQKRLHEDYHNDDDEAEQRLIERLTTELRCHTEGLRADETSMRRAIDGMKGEVSRLTERVAEVAEAVDATKAATSQLLYWNTRLSTMAQRSRCTTCLDA